MRFFKLKIIERVPDESIDSLGELKETYKTLAWTNREYGFDIDIKRIESYQSIIVNISELDQKESVRIEFDNGTYVYLAYGLDTFKSKTLPKYIEFTKPKEEDSSKQNDN